MDFYKLLSPASRALIIKRRADILNCFTLPNEDLGQRLLDLAKEAVAEQPEMDLTRQTYDTSLIVSILPELARRLGVLVPGAADTEWVKFSHKEFRYYVGLFLQNVSRHCGGYAWGFLTHEACNGNPLVVAIDRLCAGDMENKQDYIVVSIKSVAASRGKPYAGVWTPEILGS